MGLQPIPSVWKTDMLGSYTNTTHSGFMISENAETAVKHDHMLRRTRTGKFRIVNKMSTYLDEAVFSASDISRIMPCRCRHL